MAQELSSYFTTKVKAELQLLLASNQHNSRGNPAVLFVNQSFCYSVIQLYSLTFILLLLNTVSALSFSKRTHFHFISHAGGLTSLAAQVLAALALMSLYLINFLA
jgi:DNA polymerase III psi subunit